METAGQIIEEEVTKDKAKKFLLESGRYNITVEYAKRICEALEAIFHRKLIRTTRGYRENIEDASEPRVSVSDLSEYICEQLDKKPDEKILNTAMKMSGEGSYRDLKSEAYSKNL